MMLPQFILLSKHKYFSPVVYCSNTYFHIGIYIAYLWCNQKARNVCISADQLPDDGVAIKRDSTLHPFIYALHLVTFLCLFNDNSYYTATNSRSEFVIPKAPSVRTGICGTPHLDNCPAEKPTSSKYCKIFDSQIDPCVPLCCEEYQLACWSVKYNLS